VVRLSEIEIDPNQHLIDVLRSNGAWIAVKLHDRIHIKSAGFKIDPNKIYSVSEIQDLLSEAIAIRHIVREEFDQNSQPYHALSHVIFYLPD
jgi:hypothetical protein